MDATTPTAIREILTRDPLQLKLIDFDEYITNNRVRPVTSPSIFEPNSNKFHSEGLFSEEIFGVTTGMDRFVTEAYINLNTRIIHPTIFAYLFKKKAFYNSIMARKSYAVFDEEVYDFRIAREEEPGADTGYAFFIAHVQHLAKSEAPTALRAKNLHQLLVTYKKNLTTTKFLVLPAGLRDLDVKSNRLSKDDVNKIYLSLINLTAGLSGYELSEDPIFDGIRYQIQLKMLMIFEYVNELTKGKGGFFQKHYGARKIAYSTRNVISTPIMDADHPDDPTNLNSDETMVPLLNTVKAFQPFFNHYVKNRLYGELFKNGATENIPVINPKNLGIEYVSIRNSELNRYQTNDGVDRLLNQFKYVGFRESAVSIRDITRKEFWVLLTYRVPGTIWISKSATDLQNLVEQAGLEFNKDLIKPLLWVEAIYLAAIYISKEKHVVTTRYPVTGDGSIYPSKIHVITTKPSEQMTVYLDSVKIQADHYPVIGETFHESVVVHQSRLSGLGGDYDGDTISITGVWSDEGNAEIVRSMGSVSSIIGDDLRLKIKVDMDIVKFAIHNLSI